MFWTGLIRSELISEINMLCDQSSFKEMATTCGSRGNQVKLAVCAAGASFGGPIGGTLALWGCWCRFCDQNSAVADEICARE